MKQQAKFEKDQNEAEKNERKHKHWVEMETNRKDRCRQKSWDHQDKVLTHKINFTEHINNKDAYLKDKYNKRDDYIDSYNKLRQQESDTKKEEKDFHFS